MYTQKFERLLEYASRSFDNWEQKTELAKINAALSVWQDLEAGSRLVPIMGRIEMIDPLPNK